MNTLKPEIEDQDTNFAELLELHLEVPNVEEEGNLEGVSAFPKENADTSECVMPREKLRNRLRYENNATYKQHICGIAKKRQLLEKKSKSKAVIRKTIVLEKEMDAKLKEQIQDTDEFKLPFTADTLPLNNNLNTTFDDFQASDFNLEENMRFITHAAGFLRITPIRGDFLFLKNLFFVNEKLIFASYNL